MDWRVDYCIKYPFRISFFILFIGFQFHIYHIDIFLWSVRLRFYCYLLGLQRNAFVWFHPFSHSPAHNKNIAFNNFMDKTFTLGHIHVCKWHSEGISFAINSTSFDYITSYPQMWIISSISCFFTPERCIVEKWNTFSMLARNRAKQNFKCELYFWLM